jgi:hypothetical protein
MTDLLIRQGTPPTVRGRWRRVAEELEFRSTPGKWWIVAEDLPRNRAAYAARRLREYGCESQSTKTDFVGWLVYARWPA